MDCEHMGQIMRDPMTGAIGRVFGQAAAKTEKGGMVLKFRLALADGSEHRATNLEPASEEEQSAYRAASQKKA